MIQAIAAENHSQTLLNDLEVNGGSDEDDLFDDEVDGMTLPRPGRSNLHGRKDYESSCWGRMLTLHTDLNRNILNSSEFGSSNFSLSNVSILPQQLDS